MQVLQKRRKGKPEGEKFSISQSASVLSLVGAGSAVSKHGRRKRKVRDTKLKTPAGLGLEVSSSNVTQQEGTMRLPFLLSRLVRPSHSDILFSYHLRESAPFCSISPQPFSGRSCHAKTALTTTVPRCSKPHIISSRPYHSYGITTRTFATSFRNCDRSNMGAGKSSFFASASRCSHGAGTT